MAQVLGKDGKSQQQRAKVRCCMSCEWIYKGPGECPKCGWASYGGRFIFGNKVYRHLKTQEPWCNRKLSDYASQLEREIRESVPKTEPRTIGIFREV